LNPLVPGKGLVMIVVATKNCIGNLSREGRACEHSHRVFAAIADREIHLIMLHGEAAQGVFVIYWHDD